MSETSSTPDLPEVLTPQEAADILRTNPATLAQMRYIGNGPHFVRFGRSIRYLRSDIFNYLAGHTFERTDKLVSK